MIEQTLYSALSELNIALFPLVIPQEQNLPAVTYFRLRSKPTNTMQGTNPLHDNADFQINIWAADYLRMAAISVQIIEKMRTAYGANSLLLENRDEPAESGIGVYHRILIFSLREISEEGGS